MEPVEDDVEEAVAIPEMLSRGLGDGLIRDQSDQGRGILAGRRLVRGERVLQEVPLLLITSTEREELEAFEDGSLESLILGRLRECSSEDRDAFWALEDRHCKEAAKTAAGIFFTHRMEVSSFSGGDELVGEGGDDMVADEVKRQLALFLVGSSFKHSCSPNLYWSELSARGEVVFHVLCDVEPGEELTLTYSQSVLGMPMASRQELLTSWRFTCSCDACNLTGDLRSPSDERRKMLNLKMHQLGSGPARCISELDQEEIQRIQKTIELDPLEGLPIVRMICDLLDQELAGHAPTKSWACLEGFALAESAGREDLGLEFLEQGFMENCVAEGEDSENSKALGQLLLQRKGANAGYAKKVVKAKGSKPKRSGSQTHKPK